MIQMFHRKINQQKNLVFILFNVLCKNLFSFNENHSIVSIENKTSKMLKKMPKAINDEKLNSLPCFDTYKRDYFLLPEKARKKCCTYYIST